MAKRVLNLELRAGEVTEAFELLMPEQYLNDEVVRHPLHGAWRVDALYTLSDMLLVQAGIDRVEWMRMRGFNVVESGEEPRAEGEGTEDGGGGGENRVEAARGCDGIRRKFSGGSSCRAGGRARATCTSRESPSRAGVVTPDRRPFRAWLVRTAAQRGEARCVSLAI